MNTKTTIRLETIDADDARLFIDGQLVSAHTYWTEDDFDGTVAEFVDAFGADALAGLDDDLYRAWAF